MWSSPSCGQALRGEPADLCLSVPFKYKYIHKETNKNKKEPQGQQDEPCTLELFGRWGHLILGGGVGGWGGCVPANFQGCCGKTQSPRSSIQCSERDFRVPDWVGVTGQHSPPRPNPRVSPLPPVLPSPEQVRKWRQHPAFREDWAPCTAQHSPWTEEIRQCPEQE